MPLNPTVLLIIRASVEQGSAKPLRAQIRLTTDVADGFVREKTLTDIHAVAEIVEAWLHGILSGQISNDEHSTTFSLD